MPIKLKANNGNIDLKAPIKQVGGGAVDSVNGMTGDVVLEIPSKTSQLENDSGFLTQIPDEYVTETELDAKGYLTEHQSLADYAKKSEIPDVSGFITEIPSEYVTETELEAKGYLTEHQSLAEYAKKSELFSKDYNDLTNKPTIPSVEGLASEQWVESKGYLTKHQSLDEYAKKSELFSKDYNDLTNKPTIPSVEGLASTQYVDNKVSEIVVPSLDGYATEQWVEGKGYLTQHQSLADYATKSELATKQDTLTAGNNITIENGVISATGGSGGSEPDAYLKSASVSGNTLTLTNKDNTTINFTPSEGSGSINAYKFSSNTTLTTEEKNQLIDCVKNREKVILINGELVVYIKIIYSSKDKKSIESIYFSTITNNDIISIGQDIIYEETNKYNYYKLTNLSNNPTITKRTPYKDEVLLEVKNINWPLNEKDIESGKYNWMIDWAAGKEYLVWLNNCLVYYISKNSNYLYLYLLGYDSGSSGYSVGSTHIYFTDDTFTQLDTTKSYSSFATDTLLTSNNWNQYITIGGGSDWNNTTQTAWGDLYGAKELAIDWEYDGYYGCNYYNFSSNSYLGSSTYLYNNFVVGSDTSGNKCYWYYDGSQICTSNMNIRTIYYKT